MKRKVKSEKRHSPTITESSAATEETEDANDAEDAVNEFLSLYGYETVKKGELSSLQKPSVTRFKTSSESATNDVDEKCHFCKKIAAFIFEKAPLEGSDTLGFCSDACLNDYKLEIFRQEAEACLNETREDINGFSISADETDKPGCSFLITPQSWSSSNLSRRSKALIDSDKRNAKRPNDKKDKRKSNSSPISRPHPYHVLNKKYWQNIKTCSSEKDTPNEQETTQIADEEKSACDDSDQSPQSMDVKKSDSPVLINNSEPLKETDKPKNDCLALAPFTSPPASICNNPFPLNIVWIPFPFPIPIPIPVPIPIPIPIPITTCDTSDPKP